jgi:hypothetical protein
VEEEEKSVHPKKHQQKYSKEMARCCQSSSKLTFTFKESLFVVRGFGAMSAGSIGREEASRIGSSRASAE